MSKECEELKKALKTKEAKLRIAKFKLSEVNRNIKQGKIELNNADRDPNAAQVDKTRGKSMPAQSSMKQPSKTDVYSNN